MPYSMRMPFFLGHCDKKFTSTPDFCSHSILWVFGIIIRCDKENVLHFSCPGSMNLAIIHTHPKKRKTQRVVSKAAGWFFFAAISTLDFLSPFSPFCSIDMATATNINRSRTVLNLNVMKLKISNLFFCVFR